MYTHPDPLLDPRPWRALRCPPCACVGGVWDSGAPACTERRLRPQCKDAAHPGGLLHAAPSVRNQESGTTTLGGGPPFPLRVLCCPGTPLPQVSIDQKSDRRGNTLTTVKVGGKTVFAATAREGAVTIQELGAKPRTLDLGNANGVAGELAARAASAAAGAAPALQAEQAKTARLQAQLSQLGQDLSATQQLLGEAQKHILTLQRREIKTVGDLCINLLGAEEGQACVVALNKRVQQGGSQPGQNADGVASLCKPNMLTIGGVVAKLVNKARCRRPRHSPLPPGRYCFHVHAHAHQLPTCAHPMPVRYFVRSSSRATATRTAC